MQARTSLLTVHWSWPLVLAEAGQVSLAMKPKNGNKHNAGHYASLATHTNAEH